MNVKIKLESESAEVPFRVSEEAAGYDLYLPENVVVKPGRQVIPLGFKIEMPVGLMATITPRSGYSAKGMEGYVWPASLWDKKKLDENDIFRAKLYSQESRFDIDVLIGRIDSDYRGIVGVIVKSYEERRVLLTRGTRIAQMIFSKVEDIDFVKVDELSETERGEGGFGHSNK